MPVAQSLQFAPFRHLHHRHFFAFQFAVQVGVQAEFVLYRQAEVLFLLVQYIEHAAAFGGQAVCPFGFFMQHLRRQAGVAADDGVSDHGKNQARTAVKQAAAGFDIAADTVPGLVFPALRPVQCGKAMTAEKPLEIWKPHFV